MPALPDAYDVLPQPAVGQALATALVGPAFAGWMAHILLFGVTLTMFSTYTSGDRFARDSKQQKIALCTLFSVDVLAVAVSVAQAYLYGVHQDRSHHALQLGRPLDALPPVLTGFAAIIVQLTLAQRCAKFCHDHPRLKIAYLVSITTTCVLAFGASIVCFSLSSAGVDFGTASIPAERLTNLVAALWLWPTVIVDTTITCALCAVLYKNLDTQLGGSGFSRNSNNILRRVMRISLQTAALTTACAIGGAVTAIAFPAAEDVAHINVFLAFTYPLPALYTISLIVSLSDREHLKQLHDAPRSHLITTETPVKRRLGMLPFTPRLEDSSPGARRMSVDDFLDEDDPFRARTATFPTVLEKIDERDSDASSTSRTPEMFEWVGAAWNRGDEIREVGERRHSRAGSSDPGDWRHSQAGSSKER